MHEVIQQLKSNIPVFARIRPLFSREIEEKYNEAHNGSYESSRQVPVIGDLRHRNLKVLKIANGSNERF